MKRFLIPAFGLLWMASHVPHAPAPSDLPPVTRAEMMATAARLAEHTWTCRDANRRAPCVEGYASDWSAEQEVTGLPYDWGGMDDPETFDRKLAEGLAAGSHAFHGPPSACTAGVDCSGFVSLCWGSTTKHGTSTIRAISARPRYNLFTDMKPGDALNKPGKHIVLFAGYRADGNPIVYEASGAHNRVIRNDWDTWARYQGYYPLEYRMVVD